MMLCTQPLSRLTMSAMISATAVPGTTVSSTKYDVFQIAVQNVLSLNILM